MEYTGLLACSEAVPVSYQERREWGSYFFKAEKHRALLIISGHWLDFQLQSGSWWLDIEDLCQHTERELQALMESSD